MGLVLPDGVAYQGHVACVMWDKDGSHYHRGTGLTIFIDGSKKPTAIESNASISSGNERTVLLNFSRKCVPLAYASALFFAEGFAVGMSSKALC